jgi:hypothetical protein
MPTIKKIIVSGSDISQLNNDVNYALVAAISGAFTSTSASIATNLTYATSSIASLSSSLSSLSQSIVAGEFNLDFQGDNGETLAITNAETFVIAGGTNITTLATSSTDANTVTINLDDQVSLTGVTASFVGDLKGTADTASYVAAASVVGLTTFSSSASTRLTDNEAAITSLTGATSSYALKTDISGAFTAVSGGLEGRISTLENTSGGTFSSSISTRVTTLEGTGTIQGVGTTDNVTFASLTVNGDLFVSGSTTSINSANLNIEDKFILLNSGSAGSPSYEGGIIVESGSVAGAGNAFYFDASDNRWALKNGLSAENTAAVTAEAFMGIAIVDTLANAQNSVHFKEGAIIVDDQDIYIVTE